MEAMRQVMGAIYIALAEAAGGDVVLREANAVLRDALAEGAIDDPLAIAMIEILVDSVEVEGAREDCFDAFELVAAH